MKNPFDFIKGKKWIIILAGTAIGIFLIAYRPSVASDVQSGEDSFETISFYTETLEKRIEELCGSSVGIKDVSVLLTLDSG
ncbi:MAG: hypothetical protein IKN38_08980, partial [Clostridia bacterium]|nr:hypothetical protein [Clostridia bacterium]